MLERVKGELGGQTIGRIEEGSSTRRIFARSTSIARNATSVGLSQTTTSLASSLAALCVEPTEAFVHRSVVD
jgi:hypothetical protein